MRRGATVLVAMAVACELPNIPGPGVLGNPSLALQGERPDRGQVAIAGQYGIPVSLALAGAYQHDLAAHVILDVSASAGWMSGGVSPGVWFTSSPHHDGVAAGLRLGPVLGAGDLFGVTEYRSIFVGGDARLQVVYGFADTGAVGLTFGWTATRHVVNGDPDVIGIAQFPSAMFRVDAPVSRRVGLLVGLGVQLLAVEAQLGVTF